MKAKDIMIRDAITLRLDTTVDEIARLFTEQHIGGAPVVDEAGRVIGIVTERDLFLKEKGIPFSAVRLPVLFNQWVEPNRLKEIYEGARHHTAADVMTQQVICVNAEDDMHDVVLLMMRHNIKRIPVLQDGILAGIITRADIIRLLARDE